MFIFCCYFIFIIADLYCYILYHNKYFTDTLSFVPFIDIIDGIMYVASLIVDVLYYIYRG